MESNFREKQHINEQDPAEQVYKIWRKNFQELLSKHIFGVGTVGDLVLGHFLSRTL